MSVTKNGTLIPPSPQTSYGSRLGTQARRETKQRSGADFLIGKSWVLLPALLTLGGCTIASEHVSSIGARAIHGQAAVPSDAQTIEVPLKDSVVSIWYGGAFYYGLRPEVDGLVAGSVILDRSGFQNIGARHQVIALSHNGNAVKFDAYGDSYSGSKKISLQHNYGQWYWYPAQGLLVVSIPVDLALSVVTAGGFMIGMPIIVTIDAFKGKPAGSAQPSPAPADAPLPVTINPSPNAPASP